MGFDNGNGGGRGRTNRPRKSKRAGAHTSKAQAKKDEAPELGHALRSVYDSTLNEEIPPEMLDLLGKLG